MKAKLLDGKEVSKSIRKDIRAKIEALAKEGKRIPKLSVILIGDDAASAIYVNNKEKACQKVGMLSEKIVLKKCPSKEELLKLIKDLNEDVSVDGILLQLPLPEEIHEHENEFLAAIDPSKDVDGFHPINIGKLQLNLKAPVSCTPAGCIEILKYYGIDLRSKLCVIIGRSNTVGKPLIQLLLQNNATVISTHSKTKDLKELCVQADIIFTALGKAEFLKEDMVKDGAIIVDIGINRLNNGSIVGDVDFDTLVNKASYITPVPGGVGPMTIAMLLINTLQCYEMRNS